MEFSIIFQLSKVSFFWDQSQDMSSSGFPPKIQASNWLTYLVSYQLEDWFFFGRNPLELMSWLWSQKKLNFPSQKPNTRLIHKFVVNFFFTICILGVVIFRTYLMTHFNRLLDCECIIVIIYFWIERWRACSHHFWAT